MPSSFASRRKLNGNRSQSFVALSPNNNGAPPPCVQLRRFFSGRCTTLAKLRCCRSFRLWLWRVSEPYSGPWRLSRTSRPAEQPWELPAAGLTTEAASHRAAFSLGRDARSRTRLVRVQINLPYAKKPWAGRPVVRERARKPDPRTGTARHDVASQAGECTYSHLRSSI